MLEQAPFVPANLPQQRQRQSRINDRKAWCILNTEGNGFVMNVTLQHGAICVLDAADWERLQDLGVSPNWCLNGGKGGFSYVKVTLVGSNGHGHLAMVARLIMDAPKGSSIRYRDQNPLNLRRTNLFQDDGLSKRKAREHASAGVA